MRLAKEGIVRSTRWAMMRNGGLDHLPDWKRICAQLMPEPAEQKALAAALFAFAESLQQAPAMAKGMGASLEILERAMGRCIEITNSVSAACQ